MKKEVFEEYVRCLNEHKKSGTCSPFNNELLNEDIGTDLTMTIKNYNLPGGLSLKIHEALANSIF